MVQLFIIADDFNGALDTGVQFAARGAKTHVITDPYADLSRVDKDVRVLVMTAETRYMSPKDAHDIVYRAIQQAALLRIPYVYKKVDSTMRGNVGPELVAALRASGRKFLPFIPAYPANGRITRGGVQYVNGVPVAKSSFGKDPVIPVKDSDICELISHQTDMDAISRTALRSTDSLKGERGIVIYDCENTDQLKEAAERLMAEDQLHLMGGCAGLASVLPDVLGLSGSAEALPALGHNLTVICGPEADSNMLRQMDSAAAHGFVQIRLTPEQKLTRDYIFTKAGKADLAAWKKLLADNPFVIFNANDELDGSAAATFAEAQGLNAEQAKARIQHNLGLLTEAIYALPEAGTLLICNSNALLKCMNSIRAFEMEPICELAPGVVISRYFVNQVEHFIISNSDLHGEASLLTDLAARYMA